jgi:hypothetical protein
MYRRLLLLAVAVAVAVAVPTALAAKPVRTVITLGTTVIPAGFGCAFDVGVLHTSDWRITEFSDGRTVAHVNEDATLTNLDTGTSYVQRARFTETDTYDPVSNDVLIAQSGLFAADFFPGDQGPFGAVGDNGAIFAFVGQIKATLDLDTNQVTSFSYAGTVTEDVCQLLAA